MGIAITPLERPIHIGIRLANNPLTALVAGTFGVPGIALRLLLPALLTC